MKSDERPAIGSTTICCFTASAALLALAKTAAVQRDSTAPARITTFFSISTPYSQAINILVNTSYHHVLTYKTIVSPEFQSVKKIRSNYCILQLHRAQQLPSLLVFHTTPILFIYRRIITPADLYIYNTARRG